MRLFPKIFDKSWGQYLHPVDMVGTINPSQQRTPQTKENEMAREFSNGSKRASVDLQNGRYVAWVGFDADGKGDTIPARFFKGFSTCSNDYKTEAAAVKAVEKFLSR